MKKIARRATVLAALTAGFSGAYLAGYTGTGATDAIAESSPDPVKVEAVHEESGELAEVKVTDGDGEVIEAQVEEKWKGNEDSEDGLHGEDPAAVNAPEGDENEAGEAEVQPEDSEPVKEGQEVAEEDESEAEEQETDEYMGLEPWYTDDGSGAVVLIVYSDDDERAVEDVFVIVGGEQVPVDHLDER